MQCIFYFCKENSITLKVVWIPREELSSVDRQSKIIDHYGWRTTKPFSAILNNLRRSLTIDRFADHENSKTRKFNSKFYVLFTEGVHAFNFHWSDEISYSVPSVFLIPKVIKHLEKCRCQGVFVVPYWPSAVFWPLSFETKNIYKPFIKGTNISYNSQEITTQGNNKKCFIVSDKIHSLILALNIDFS